MLVAVAPVGTFAFVTSAAGSAPFEQAEFIGASGFAALKASVAPVRAVCLAAHAVGQVVGMVGGFLRLTGGSPRPPR
jgi:hypothetical protein